MRYDTKDTIQYDMKDMIRYDKMRYDMKDTIQNIQYNTIGFNHQTPGELSSKQHVY